MSQNKETEIQLQYIEKCKELLAKNSAKHPTFHIQNEGCQMNSIQTESIAAIMEKMGYEMVDTEDADAVVFNTCTVRENAAAALQLGQEVLTQEAGALTHLASTLGSEFTDAVSRILSCKGRLIVSGVGKSGHIGRKLAATFASTGTPAYFVHAAEAAHGDLGMITADDVVLAISYSGETNELLTIVPTLKREGATLIAITGNPNSSLAQHADVHLNCHVSREACPLNLAPTTSTTATLALGDALAVATLSAKGFTKEDFARSHPGGALGRRLLIHVQDIMRTGEDIPAVREEVGVLEAVREITKKHIGMTAVVDDEGRVTGIFTEGDLRRLIERLGDIRPCVMKDVMIRNPKTIRAQELAASAVKLLDTFHCNQLLVVDEDNRLIGALHLHDLMGAKVL